MRQFYLTILICIGIVLLSHGQITWTGDSSNIFEDPNNWDLGRSPIQTDIVIFPGGNPYAVEINNGARIQAMRIGGQVVVHFYGDVLEIDGTGCANCHGIEIQADATLNINSGDLVKIKHTDRDGIHNNGTLVTDRFVTLIIDSIGDKGIYNSNECQLDNSLTIIKQTENESFVGTTGSTTEIHNCSWLLSESNIVNQGLFTNNGSIVERSSGNSSISINNGFLHNLSGGSFNTMTNTGFRTSSSIVNYATNCSGNIWNRNKWSRYEVPSADDFVIFHQNSGDFLNFSSEGSFSNHMQIDILVINEMAELNLNNLSLEVNELVNAGRLNINGDPESARLIINQTQIALDSIVNDGIIVNLSGIPIQNLRNTLNGVVNTSRTTSTWTGSLNNNWNNANNWSPNTVPSATDDVFIPIIDPSPEINGDVGTIGALTLAGDLNITNTGILKIDNGPLFFENEMGINILDSGRLENNGQLSVENAFGCGISVRGLLRTTNLLNVKNANSVGITTLNNGRVEVQSNGQVVIDSCGVGTLISDSAMLVNEGHYVIKNINKSGITGYTNSALVVAQGGFVRNSDTLQVKEEIGGDAIRVDGLGSCLINEHFIGIDSSEDDGLEADDLAIFENKVTATLTILGYGNDGIESDDGSRIINHGNIMINNLMADVITDNPIEIDDGSILINSGMIQVDTNLSDEQSACHLKDGSLLFNSGSIDLKNRYLDPTLWVGDYCVFNNLGTLTLQANQMAIYLNNFGAFISMGTIITDILNINSNERFDVELGSLLEIYGQLSIDYQF